MNKLAAAVLAPIVAVVLLVAAAVAAVTSLTGGTGGIPALGCHIPSQAATAAPAQPATTVPGLDEEQTANAATIVSVGQGLGVPPRGWVIAIATALQESGLRNLDHGDRDSLGLFQQRPSMGWGTREQIMDPTYAATVFYERLLQVPGWQDLPLTEAAQAVQRSAFPDAYARHEQRATEIVAALGQLCGPGAWVAPVTGEVISGFRTAERPDHYGIDIPAARGTPVVAAAAGTVTVATCQATIDGQPTSCDIDGGPLPASPRNPTPAPKPEHGYGPSCSAPALTPSPAPDDGTKPATASPVTTASAHACSTAGRSPSSPTPQRAATSRHARCWRPLNPANRGRTPSPPACSC